MEQIIEEIETLKSELLRLEQLVKDTDKKRKREEHTLQRILESIPGVSERMAGVIVGSFPTLGDIQHALKHTPEALEQLAHTPKRRIDA